MKPTAKSNVTPTGKNTQQSRRAAAKKKKTIIISAIAAALAIAIIITVVVAAISLVVGGIGIMNIMLVSVTERTREIGIRKAVGAKRKHIMFQFLCEACVLSVLGGLIGLGLSFAGIQIYNLVASASTAMNWGVGGAAIAFCAVIGIVFGGYPAAKASRLQPIDALHNS